MRIALGIALGVMIVSLSAGGAGPASQPTSRPAGRKIRIGYDTTRLNGPLKADGTVNYAAALNQRYGKGVTLDNNAAVKIVEALGPEFLNETSRDLQLKALGVKLPAEAKYFRSAHLEIDLEVTDRLFLGPWRAADHPKAAQWLAENREAFAKIIQASRRSRLFVPLPSGEDASLVDLSTWMPRYGSLRDISKALLMRASLVAGEGRTDAAWGDILAVHRLGRLVHQDPVLIGRVVAIALTHLADRTVQSLATSEGLSADQAKAMLRGLQTLSRIPSVAECLDVGERYFGLESYADLATNRKRGMKHLNLEMWLQFVQDERQKEWIKFVISVLESPERTAGVDWNEAMRLSNEGFDQIAAAVALPTYAQRRAAYKKLAVEEQEEVRRVMAWWEKHAASQPAKIKWRKHVDARWVMSALSLAFRWDTPEGYEGIRANSQTLMDRIGVHADLTKLSVALAGYRAQKGEYPAKLAALSPAWLKEIPQDFFSGTPFIYERAGKGYLLYSVGRNARDDGGVNKGLEADDLAVKVGTGEADF